MVPGWINYLFVPINLWQICKARSTEPGKDVSHGFVADHGKENWVNERAWGLSTIAHGGAHQIKRIR